MKWPANADKFGNLVCSITHKIWSPFGLVCFDLCFCWLFSVESYHPVMHIIVSCSSDTGTVDCLLQCYLCNPEVTWTNHKDVCTVRQTLSQSPCTVLTAGICLSSVGAVGGDCQWSMKNGGNSLRSHDPTFSTWSHTHVPLIPVGLCSSLTVRTIPAMCRVYQKHWPVSNWGVKRFIAWVEYDYHTLCNVFCYICVLSVDFCIMNTLYNCLIYKYKLPEIRLWFVVLPL